MKNVIYTLSVLVLISCTKEFDDDIFSFDIDEISGLDPVTGEPIVGVDPVTGEPIVGVDPVTGEPIVDIDPVTGESIDEDMEEDTPILELSGDNELLSWTVDINGQNIAPEGGQRGNVIELTYPAGTDISNVDIILEIPETATVDGNTTGINFNTNDGIILIAIVAENDDENTFAFGIEVAEE